MKKLGILVMAMVMVFGLSLGVMAEELDSDTVDVYVTIAEHAEFEIEDSNVEWTIDESVPDYPDDTERIWTLSNNTIVQSTVSFGSFGHDVDDLISLEFGVENLWSETITPGETDVTLGTTPSGSGSGYAKLLFDENSYEGNWEDYEAAENLSSTITVTVAAVD